MSLTDVNFVKIKISKLCIKQGHPISIRLSCPDSNAVEQCAYQLPCKHTEMFFLIDWINLLRIVSLLFLCCVGQS